MSSSRRQDAGAPAPGQPYHRATPAKRMRRTMPRFGVKRRCPGHDQKNRRKATSAIRRFLVHISRRPGEGVPWRVAGGWSASSDDPVGTETSPSRYIGAGIVLPARRLKKFRQPPRLGPFLSGARTDPVAGPDPFARDSQLVGLCANGKLPPGQSRKRLDHRSSRMPLKNGWRTLPSADFARYSISASNDGSTQKPRCAILCLADQRFQTRLQLGCR
jgi:hypothetical protein